MSKISLLEPLLDKGIRNTNFFNGRLLSAEDLRAEQEANRQHDEQLGRAIGDGIAYGLEAEKKSSSSPAVATTEAVVQVSAGLAINRQGQTLELAEDIDVALVRGNPTLEQNAGLFVVCPGASSSAIPTVGTGVYLLVITPAAGFSGRAPASGLGESQILAGKCGSRYTVEGVQFRLVEFNPGNILEAGHPLRNEINQLMSVNDPASLSRLRSLLAYLCFGVDQQEAFRRHPFKLENNRSPYHQYGALDALRATRGLTDCDVTLGLIYWTGSGIQFVDGWAVRRRLTDRAVTATWDMVTGDRRLKEAEAMFLQFQAQIEEMQESGAALEPVVAVNYFRYLPPVGVLPLTGKPGVTGFDFQEFFAGLNFKPPVLIEGARVEPLIRQSLSYAPLDLSSNQPVWLYTVRENLEAIAESGSDAPQPYLIFASGYTPFQGLVEPEDPTAETIEIELQDYRPRPIREDLPATFEFRVKSLLATTADFTFIPVILVDGSNRVWKQNLNIEPREMELEPDEETQVTVQLEPVPDGTNGVEFGLRLRAETERVSRTSDLYEFTVGRTADDVDTGISLRFKNAQLNPPANTVNSEVIGFPKNNDAVVTLTAEIRKAGTFVVDAEINPSAGWRLKVLTPTVKVTANDLLGRSATRLLKFSIAPRAGAQNSQVEFRIGARDARARRTYKMELMVDAKGFGGGSRNPFIKAILNK